MQLIKSTSIVCLALLLSACASRTDGPSQNRAIDLAELPKDATSAAQEREVIADKGLLLEREVLPSADRSKVEVVRVPISSVDETPSALPQSRPSQPRTFPVTVRFAGTKIDSVLQVFARSAGYNLVSNVGNGNRPINLDIDGLPWIEAYDLVQEIASLETVFDDKLNLMRVYDQGGFAQVEEGIIRDAIDQADRVERFRRLATRDPSEPKVIERFMLRHIQPDEAKAELDQAIEALYGNDEGSSEFKPSVIADTDPASLIMRGTSRQLDEAAGLLSQIDILPKQVIIEAFFVEVGDDFEQALGARLSGQTSNPGRFGLGTAVGGRATGDISEGQPGVTTDDFDEFGQQIRGFSPEGEAFNFLPSAGTFGVTLIDNLTSGQLRLELAALQEDRLSRTVSAPKILTRSGEEGSIARTRTTFYKEDTVVGTGENATTTTEVKELAAPLALTITPTVVGDYIHMDVSLENTTFGPIPQVPEGETPLPPETNTVSVETGKLILKTGEIVVVGGVTSQSASDGQTGVPGLSKAPGIGRLFRQDSESNELNQLLIFIAPRVI